MGKVVRFFEFDNYFNDLVSRGIKAEGTILDANIIITIGHEPKKFHTRLDDFIKSKITARGIKLFYNSEYNPRVFGVLQKNLKSCEKGLHSI